MILMQLSPRWAVVIVILLLAACGKRASEAPEPLAAVQVRQAAQLQRAEVIRAGGNVEAYESSELGFQVPGRIRRMLVEEGQLVSQGQLLAELDPTDYRLGAEIAEGEAAAARAMADKARAGVRRQELEQARAAYEQAEDEYRRMKTLFERKSLAPIDFRKIETHWQVARQRYEEAMEGARREDREAAEAKLRQAEANARLNRKRVEDTQLRAPLAGVVARRLADTGEMVSAGMPVVALMRLHPARVRVGVPEAEIGKVGIGQTARVRIPSLDGREFAAKVELVGFAAEPQSRTFPVRLLAPNPRLELRAGMIAEAEIETGARVAVRTVPADAVWRDPQGATHVFVYSPQSGRVHARRVRTGRGAGREVEIAEGLGDGDLVVIGGQHKVKDGMRVQAEILR
ncbi:MAG: resistance-nodulation-cell division efflux membrane fusion protein [Bryobacteraceae bacterium]|nr:MAG: resistance-nodulation-cell division efflux membrane fusion protein [Bryobacteraceae bacterium]